jgi:hypothetical protein
MIYIIATILNGKDTVGYRLYNTKAKEIKDVEPKSLVTAMQASLKGGVSLLANAALKDGQIKGTQGTFSRYPQLQYPTLETMRDAEPYIIIGKTPIGEFVVVEHNGRESTLTEKELMRTSKWKGVANGKVVPKGDSRYISAISGEFETIGEKLTYLEKVFKCPNTSGQIVNWKVRILKNGDKYGRDNCLTNEGKPLVEFISMDVDKKAFPDGQFVSRYYLSTLLERPKPAGLCLDGGVNAWAINSQNYLQIDTWLSGLKLD